MKPNQDQNVNIEVLKVLEPTIIKLLAHLDKWKTLDVDYHPPRVERLYTVFEDYRIHLHVIHHTDEKCLFHKHRWPAAFKQLYGSYEMGITYSEKEISSEEAHKLPTLIRTIISPGSYYEMCQTDALHYVRPISDLSYSIMLTKELYHEAEFRKEIVDKKLNELSDLRKSELLQVFSNLIGS